MTDTYRHHMSWDMLSWYGGNIDSTAYKWDIAEKCLDNL